ncbi:EAL domain-containing protein [Rhodococcus sp. 06-418-5]|uniref:EAL domain-containing protein n=1 Tax=Rhodococcus sp. 06-418-5 TaxID=2022507 RepID=UPI002796208F|nr:EAL domain-containing protein [Rhodococcus sp. 06-418-5]
MAAHRDTETAHSPSTSFSESIGLVVTMQFAPIRRLDDNALAGAELQLRGPAGSALDSADALRRAAHLMQQRPQFDLHKTTLANTAPARTLAEHLPLILTVDAQSRRALDDSDRERTSTMLERVVVTVDASAVLADPHQAMAAIASARTGGKLIALDGVGDHPHATTLLPLIEPDIVITAADLLTETGHDVGTTTHALAAYAERSHAVIVAEGVDTEATRLAAITIGATYGTGQLFPAVEDPAELLDERVVPMPADPVWTTPTTDSSTPYAIASAHATARRGTKKLLIQMSKSLEAHAAASGSSMIALGTFQRAQHFTPTTSARWHHLAETIGFAGVYGVGLPALVDGNVRHAPLDPGDPLVQEWTVITLGPHHAALLSARDRHDNGPDLDRTFDFVQTFDRATVTQAARAILRRYPH